MSHNTLAGFNAYYKDIPDCNSKQKKQDVWIKRFFVDFVDYVKNYYGKNWMFLID